VYVDGSTEGIYHFVDKVQEYVKGITALADPFIGSSVWLDNRRNEENQ
jgi:hypothetical protein